MGPNNEIQSRVLEEMESQKGPLVGHLKHAHVMDSSACAKMQPLCGSDSICGRRNMLTQPPCSAGRSLSLFLQRFLQLGASALHQQLRHLGDVRENATQRLPVANAAMVINRSLVIVGSLWAVSAQSPCRVDRGSMYTRSALLIPQMPNASVKAGAGLNTVRPRCYSGRGGVQEHLDQHAFADLYDTNLGVLPQQRRVCRHARPGIGYFTILYTCIRSPKGPKP